MDKIGFVTSNLHKFDEINAQFTRDVPELYHIKMKYGEMQGDSSSLVAQQSAATLATYLSPPFFIEDSGLFVDHLNGFPGVYSSYVFSTIGYDGVLKMMKEVDNRRAKFYSVIVFVDKSGSLHTFTGEVKGSIADSARGDGGFGFDPIFIPDGYQKTFAELSLEEKNHFSHRGRSTKQFIEFLKQFNSGQA